MPAGHDDTRYVEPTGLSSQQPVQRAGPGAPGEGGVRAPHHPRAVDFAGSGGAGGRRALQFRNTNGLVRNPEWEIGLQKTGYISAAGRVW
jgi:D-alanyl-D-alanine endopeptidase (penicillin-binding protein 7)